jgi:hypothetical protein
MPDTPILHPAENAARLREIIAERRALHAEEFKRLSAHQRAYVMVGQAVPISTGKKRGRKKAEPAPAEPTPLLDQIDDDPDGSAAEALVPQPGDGPLGRASEAARLIGEHDDGGLEDEVDTDDAEPPIGTHEVRECVQCKTKYPFLITPCPKCEQDIYRTIQVPLAEATALHQKFVAVPAGKGGRRRSG